MKKYDVSEDEVITSEMIIKHRDSKNAYAAQFDRLQLKIDKLLEYTDVNYDGKEDAVSV